MKASQTLPQGYRACGEISLKNKTLLLWLNLLAVPWFLGCAIFLGSMTNFLRPLNFAIMPHVFPMGTRLGAGEALAMLVVALFIAVGVILVLHELTHGLFFWLFTKSRPVYGFKGWYAYAAAPGWYLPRLSFLVVLGAPLVLLSLLGEALVLLVPDTVALLVLWAMIINAGVAIGDLYMILRLLLAPKALMIEDSRIGIKWYAPAKPLAFPEEPHQSLSL